MTSILKVDNIQNSSGTSAISIDSSGVTTFPSNPVCIDQYRLTGNHSGNGIVTAWEQVDDATFSNVGTAMSVSSGIYTFPSTGVYRVFLYSNGVTASGDSAAVVYIYASSDSGTNYDITGFAVTGGAGMQFSMSAEAFVNVTNTSTFRLKLESSSFSSGTALHGDTNGSRTALSFVRLADSQ